MTAAALGSATASSTSYFRSNPSSVSGLPPADDDDNDVDEPVASSEEEENKPRIWSIADVATSCRPLQQRGGSLGLGAGLVSVGSGAAHSGFLHPWTNGSSSFNYANYQPTNSQAACTAATAGFYASYYQQQQQNQQRPVTTPVARQQQLPTVPIGMATAHQQPNQLTSDAVRCSQLQSVVGGVVTSQYPHTAAGSAFDVASMYTRRINVGQIK
jgi:hypothetical protein